MPVRSLFGGSIVADLPLQFEDVSNIRLIPDNQEVLCDIDTDQSVIIELLSLVEDEPNETCAEFHFNEISFNNDAYSEKISIRELYDDELPHLSDPKIYKALAFGQQEVSKFKESARNLVNIYMAVIRIPSVSTSFISSSIVHLLTLYKVTTDIVISVNEPVAIHEQSSSAKSIRSFDFSTSEARTVFANLLQSFQIMDWNLFCAD